MLTRKQHDLLVFVNDRVRETGVPPSFDEMKDALDLRSKSGIHRLITALEERGFIRRLPNRARALEILKLPESIQGNRPAPVGRTGFKPSVIEGSRDTARPAPAAQPAPAKASASTSIPVMGRIAAGVPISAVLFGGRRASPRVCFVCLMR